MTYRFMPPLFRSRYPLVGRLGVATALASITLMAGAINVSLPSRLGGGAFGTPAMAQDRGAVTPEEIRGYAASVLQMDAPRNEAYGQIRTLLSGTNQDISGIDMSCTGTANLNQLPRNLRSSIRAIVVNYCNQASEIVQANGLKVRRFNAITAAYPQDPALAEQIRAAMVQLQQQSANGIIP
jgi:hypothetical protein